MSTLYQPSDTVVGPIIHELAQIVRAQIEGIGRIYETPPDGAPEHNSVTFPYTLESSDETVGKLLLKLGFDIHHNFRRHKFSDDFVLAQQYVIPWILVMGTWTNQTLGGLTMAVNPGKVNVRQYMTSQTPLVAVIAHVDVLTELNIPLI